MSDPTILLNGDYKLSTLLRKGPHADVYLVCSNSSCTSQISSVEELEARVYVLEDIPDKLRRYRLKSIKRLASRTVFEVKVDGSVVVVYKVDRAGIEDEKNEVRKETEPVSGDEGEGWKVVEMEHKSDRQRETARIQQLTRRRLNRRKKLQKVEHNQSDGKSVVGEAVQEETNDEETLNVLLHLAYNHRPDLCQKFLPGPRAVLEKYLHPEPLKFKYFEEVPEFMAVKLHEVQYLERLVKKLPGIERRKKDSADLLLRQQLLLSNESELKDYKLVQNKVTVAQHELRVVQLLQEHLPKVIDDAGKIYRNVDQRWKLTQGVKEEIDRLTALNTEWDMLKRKVIFCERLSQEVVPGSEPYARGIRRLQDAEEELRAFDDSVGKTLMARLESSRKKYEILAKGIPGCP